MGGAVQASLLPSHLPSFDRLLGPPLAVSLEHTGLKNTCAWHPQSGTLVLILILTPGNSES